MKETKKDRTPNLKKLRDTESFTGKKKEQRKIPPILKKLAFLIIILAVLAAIYASVVGIGYAVLSGKQPISDSELTARMEELIPAAREINEIIWGEGLPLDPDAEPLLDTVTGAQYRPVAPDAVYKSTDELRSAISEVYSSAYIASAINYTAFDGSEGADDGYELYPRYSDMRLVNDDGSTTDILGIDITNKGFSLTASLDPNSVKFERRILSWNGLWWESDLITVSLTENYNNSSSTREINLRLEDGIWLLDDPTY